MNKLAQHLQQFLHGEVFDEQRALEYFSTDGSILTLKPRAIVYPRNTEDVRKVVRFSYGLAERGKFLPITARGKGTDQAGAAIGQGLMLVFPAHMTHLLQLAKSEVTVQPGMIYGDLQRTLHSHGRFFPPYPSSIEFSTIGGAIANNAAGEKTPKYGMTSDYVARLQVVLSNGQVIDVKKLSKKALNHKKGLTGFEGDIYRKLDGLLLDNQDVIEKAKKQVTKNSAGYNLWEIKGKDGSFDLTKLFTGSQGTLGIVTQATLRTEVYQPHTELLVAYFDNLNNANQAIAHLHSLNPSTMEVVDANLLEFLQQHQPQRLAGVIDGDIPKVMLLIEFDDAKARQQSRKVKKARRILDGLATRMDITANANEQEAYWNIRRSAAAVIWRVEGNKKALPIIEAAVVPVEKFSEFLVKTYRLLKKHHLEIAIWGHAADANIHMQPYLDLASTGDRQKVFKLMDEFYKMVIGMGGSTAGEHGDGRLRAPYLKDLYGEQMYGLFAQVKEILDPYNILNPGVKIDVTKEDVKPLLRHEYSMKHLYDHMPHIS